MTTDPRPPIPASCAHRPTIGGLVIPLVNIQLADGGVDFRTRHQASFARCWEQRLCQICGTRLQDLAVLLGSPTHLSTRHFDEAPLCPPCAIYATKACPMVAGRQPFFSDRPALSEGHRGQRCAEPGCGCQGLISVESEAARPKGRPAHAWYALYVSPSDLKPTAYQDQIRCSDGGCTNLHPLVVVDGGLLTGRPRKAVQVSEPGGGRVWRRLTDDETHQLLNPPPGREDHT